MNTAQRTRIAFGIAALAFFAVAANAHPLDNTRLAHCLKGWEDWGLANRLPYFPRLRAGNCSAEEPKATVDGNGFSGMAPRRLKLELWYETEWYPRLPGQTGSGEFYETLRRESARAAMLHFERLLLAQKFERTEGVSALQEPRRDGEIVGYAAYERVMVDGVRRVELRRAGYDNLSITLEQRGAPREEIRLPAPDESFDFAVHDSARRLFALPGLTLISERVTFFSQGTIAVPSGGPGTDTKEIPLNIPVRELTFRTDKVVPEGEVNAALREALKHAGWKSLSEPVQYVRGTPVYRYFLRQHHLDAGIFSTTDHLGRTMIFVTLADPAIAPKLAPLTGLFGGLRKDWEIAPEFDGAGNPSAKTRTEIFVFAAHTPIPERISAAEQILVTPIVREESARDPAQQSAARHAARWVVEELVQRGVDRRQIRVLDDVLQPRLPQFGVERGVRVSRLTCRTLTESRPDGLDKQCQCREGDVVLSTTPGACP